MNANLFEPCICSNWSINSSLMRYAPKEFDFVCNYDNLVCYQREGKSSHTCDDKFRSKKLISHTKIKMYWYKERKVIDHFYSKVTPFCSLP